MSMISAQIDELRNTAEFYDGFKAANLMRDAADTIWELRDDLQRTNAENAKLRELVRAAWRCIHTGASCSDCRLIAGGCTLQTAMRELRVEL